MAVPAGTTKDCDEGAGMAGLAGVGAACPAAGPFWAGELCAAGGASCGAGIGVCPTASEAIMSAVMDSVSIRLFSFQGAIRIDKGGALTCRHGLTILRWLVRYDRCTRNDERLGRTGIAGIA